jgi:hypothetical protein
MNHYAEYTHVLKTVCKDRQLLLNYKQLDGYRFYYITLNPNRNKTVVFSAGIHGDEEAGPFAVLKFLQEYEITSKRVVLFPVVNPYGFDRRVRKNGLRLDLNRRFCDNELEGEAKIAYQLLCKFRPCLFVSMHEFYGKEGYYMYASDRKRKQIYERIPRIAAKYFKIFRYRINDEPVENGIIWHPETEYTEPRNRSTLENRMHTDGVHYICTETPNQASMMRRVEVQFNIMKFVLENLV